MFETVNRLLEQYDGSKEKDPEVDSLYRYYDHYDLLGRPKTGA